MITRKSRLLPKAVVWPYTPDPSPRLAPVVANIEVDDDFKMSEEQYTRSRPISMASPRGMLSPGGRPTLDDVLKGRAAPPYTLAAYTAFLSEQHCLETLEFTVECRKYQEKHDEAAAHLAGMPLNVESDEGFELQQDWARLLDIYVKPGAPREINLPAEERDDLVDFPYHTKPPPPEALNASVKRMYDLMSDSIFIPFCNSLRTTSHAQTYNALSEYSNIDARMDHSRLTFDDRRTMHERNPPKRRKSPHSTSKSSSKSSSSTFAPSRSPPSQNRPPQTSNLSSALGHTSGARLSHHVSNSSAVSGESAITDDSASGESPLPSVTFSEPEVMSPPTTPPGNELERPSMSMSQTLSTHSQKTQRSESGGWKKMFNVGGKKKKNGSSLTRDDAS